jgi:protein tyrosine phosphatase (PTP) superfamily phosphohydrolase (DUF442 family)
MPEMTTIKTTCKQCGDIELQPQHLRLELDPAGDEGNYRFTCPTCDYIQRRPANSRVVSVLLATGVGYEVLPIDPITEREIETFVQALDTEEDVVRLFAT